MTTISKFYLHTATSGDTGTMPSASDISGGSGTAYDGGAQATGASTARAMDDVIGSSQTSAVLTTLASTAFQSGWLARFVSAPIAAQTIASQSVTLSYAASESNAASNFNVSYGVTIWRPSSGSWVADILTAGTTQVLNEPGTSETAATNTATSSAATSQDGDIIVVEVFRSLAAAQSMSTAYTNTFFYDGTTEASATSNAAFLSFTNSITMFTPATGNPSPIRSVNQAVNRAAVY